MVKCVWCDGSGVSGSDMNGEDIACILCGGTGRE